MTLPPAADLAALLAVSDVVERAKLLARSAHAECIDKAGQPYYEADLLAAGFSDSTVLIVHLMTRRDGEPVEVYDARLRSFEPARRLKLDGDVASNADPTRLAQVEPVSTRHELRAKYDTARSQLSDRFGLHRFVEAQDMNDGPGFLGLTPSRSSGRSTPRSSSHR